MRFASLFVQVLNVILLTADEASELCAQLRSCFPAGQEGGKALFDQLFPAWSLNAFSAQSQRLRISATVSRQMWRCRFSMVS